MRTLLPDPPPAEFEALLEQRKRTGADTHDEIWEGVYRLMPAARGRHGVVQAQLVALLTPPAAARGLLTTVEFNLGEQDNLRVPDLGLHRDWRDSVYYDTAALVVEIVSPGDSSWEKLPFYAEHHVDELLIVDPGQRTIDWLALTEGEYEPIGRSALIELGPAELAAKIDWPPVQAE